MSKQGTKDRGKKVFLHKLVIKNFMYYKNIEINFYKKFNEYSCGCNRERRTWAVHLN